MRGPRVYEASGIPLHKDNQTIVKERIRLDKNNADLMLNDITSIDNALTRPWTVTRQYRRVRNPSWVDYSCSEDNMYVYVENETYFIGADGKLMPTRKDQPPPDLRYFNQAQKNK